MDISKFLKPFYSTRRRRRKSRQKKMKNCRTKRRNIMRGG
jgi:hypothetical protein